MPNMRPTLIAMLATFAIGGAMATTPEMDFMEQNAAAMGRMMKSMSVPPSGDVDADFVNMMEPHHQGAIDMAVLELRYGHNARLLHIAQEIIGEQHQEIDGMRIALGRPLPPAAPASDQAATAR